MRQPNSTFAMRRLLVFFMLGCIGLGCSKGAIEQGATDAQAVALSEMPLAANRNGVGRETSRETGLTDLQFNTEAYDSIRENPFFAVLDQPQSTFSVDVDTASYANVRRLLRAGNRPASGAVRLEELVNYFSYDYPEPEGAHPFSVTTERTQCPWNEKHQLLRIGLRGKSINFRERGASNFVFLLDVSGSMMQAEKLPLVKQAMKLLTEALSDQDRISIVVYAGASGLVLDSTPASRADLILAAIDELQAGGSTNGGEGIQLAYRVAEGNFVDGGVNRVILCTDGDFNVGIANQSDLIDMVESKAESGVQLTVLGFGTGNIKDSTMEKLADRGNGNYAYIDSELEARKVLIEEAGGTLVTIAKDVKIQVDFNPLFVQEYRLLGYENRLLENRDFRDDNKDAGEIGAGHTVTAFYELVPVGEDTGTERRKSEFVTQRISQQADPETMLSVNLRYKLPEASRSVEFQQRHKAAQFVAEPSPDFQFASAVLAYGMLLRDSSYVAKADWDWVIATAQENLGEDPRGLRQEFLQLAKTAKRLVATQSGGQQWVGRE